MSINSRNGNTLLDGGSFSPVRAATTEAITLAELQNGCRDGTGTGSFAGVCDLQEALGLDRNNAGQSTLDSNGDGVVDISATELAALNHTTQHFLQRVRGYCVAHCNGARYVSPCLRRSIRLLAG